MFWNQRWLLHVFVKTSAEVRANQKAQGRILIGWIHRSNMEAQLCKTVPRSPLFKEADSWVLLCNALKNRESG